jgi:rod shape-determining protein MreD
MNPYLVILGLGLVALVQVSALPAFAIGSVAPDLMLVIVVSWALLRDLRSAMGWALAGGLALDLLAGSPFGMYTLGLLVAAVVAGSGGNTLYRGSLLLPVAMLGLATLARTAVHLAVLLITGYALPTGDTLLRLVLMELAYNTVLLMVVYPLLAMLSRATGRERIPLE